MPIVAIIAALVQGLAFISGLIPGIQGSQTVQDIEKALAALAKVVPTVQELISLLQNPTAGSPEQARAAIAAMNQHVADWDNRAAPKA